jgi:dipeptidyl aminopeptidase/acylaminoacyl peptidase
MPSQRLLITVTAALLALALPARAEPPSLARYLSIRSCSGGAPAPDSQSVAFLYNVTGVSQVWKVDRPGAWPTQLTFGDNPVASVWWSPRGGWLVFSRDAGGDERTQLYLLSPDGGEEIPLTANPGAIHGFGGFSPDGSRIAYGTNERNGRDFDIYVVDLKTRQRRLVHQGQGALGVAAWSPGGDRLILARHNTNLDVDLLLLELATGAVRHLTPHEGTVRYFAVHWPEGERLYLLSDLGREFTGLATLDLGTGRLDFLEPDRHDAEALAVDRRGRFLVVSHNVEGVSRLELRPCGPGPARPLELPAGVAEGLVLSEDSRRLVFSWSTPVSPQNVWMVEIDPDSLRAGSPVMVTRPALAGIPESSFVRPEPLSYPTFDGRQIPALLYYPPAARGPVPAVVAVHGGPESQERPRFTALYQYLVARGYAVMLPNVRGSTGYGRAYTHLDDVEKRMDSIRDLEYAWRWLASSERVDPRRVAVMGGSYGGYMTLAALAFQPDLWAAGVDVVGMSNLKTFLTNTGPWRQALRVAEYGHPQRDAELLERLSPYYHVEKIRAPLLVIQGAKDPRVPRSEADQIVSRLRETGRPVEYLLFEDEGHGLARFSNRVKAYTQVADFLDRHLK